VFISETYLHITFLRSYHDNSASHILKCWTLICKRSDQTPLPQYGSRSRHALSLLQFPQLQAAIAQNTVEQFK